MRARNIKPGFFKNEVLGELDPLIRILFEGLWCVADREGRFEWRPKRLKAEILPYDNGDVTVMLQTLCEKGFIQHYQVQGEEYGLVTHFLDHQRPHHTEKASILPPLPDNGELTVNSPLKDGENPPDSLIPDSLIPDSLIPEKDPLSAKPDDTQKTASPKNRNGTPPYQEIIEYLNEKTGKAFKPQTKETQRHIKARWNAGFGVGAFKQVIDNKVAKWATDPKMADYLRPETLFGTKFESYLNEQPFGTQDNEPAHPSHRILTRSDDA